MRVVNQAGEGTFKLAHTELIDGIKREPEYGLCGERMKRHSCARIFTGAISFRKVAGIVAQNGALHEASPFGLSRLAIRIQTNLD